MRGGVWWPAWLVMRQTPELAPRRPRWLEPHPHSPEGAEPLSHIRMAVGSHEGHSVHASLHVCTAVCACI